MSITQTALLVVILVIVIVGPAWERSNVQSGVSTVERSRWTALANAIWWAVCAVINLFHRDMPFCIVDGIGAALWGHLAWELWRRNRKPRAERAAGRVVNLGHRLAIRANAS